MLIMEAFTSSVRGFKTELIDKRKESFNQKGN